MGEDLKKSQLCRLGFFPVESHNHGIILSYSFPNHIFHMSWWRDSAIIVQMDMAVHDVH